MQRFYLIDNIELRNTENKISECVILVESNHTKIQGQKEKKYSSCLTEGPTSTGQLKTIYQMGNQSMKMEERMGKKITLKIIRVKNF